MALVTVTSFLERIQTQQSRIDKAVVSSQVRCIGMPRQQRTPTEAASGARQGAGLNHGITYPIIVDSSS